MRRSSYDADGKHYAADSVVTPGAPASLRLTIDWPAQPATIVADGQDVALLTATVLTPLNDAVALLTPGA
jgi:hypothetical protein